MAKHLLPASPHRFLYCCAFLNNLHCNSQKGNLLSDLCCHDFCIKLSTTRIPAADVCRISRLLFKKSQRDISIYAAHMPNIRHIPAASDLLWIERSTVQPLCKGWLPTAIQAAALVRFSSLSCHPLAENAMNSLTYPDNLLVHHQRSAEVCLVSTNPRKIARLLILPRQKLQKVKEGVPGLKLYNQATESKKRKKDTLYTYTILYYILYTVWPATQIRLDRAPNNLVKL